MAKGKTEVSRDTHRQLLWTQDHNIPIGAIEYWTSLGEKTPIYLNYKGHEDEWDDKAQIVLNQGEFASLELGYMFFKDPSLNKNNPYIYKEAWANIGLKNEDGTPTKKPYAAFQQLLHDNIQCKIIADGETIDAINALKRYEDCRDIIYTFDILENYNVQLNVPKRQRKMVYSNKGNYEIEITNVEDYDQDVDYERMNWRDRKYLIDADKEWHRNYNRIEMLEKKIEIYQSRIDPSYTKFAEVLINAYPHLKIYEALPKDMWTFGPQDLRQNISKISRMYNGAGYKSIWQTWYNYQVKQMKKELEYLEELIL